MLLLEDYLAQEETLARTVQEPIFFTWRVAPTVIYGRHQCREQEVNESYCQSHGIRIVQRKSGGGCVYADEGNIMLSYISPSTHSEQVFHSFLHQVAAALCQLGYQAVTTQHNDILVQGYKVAGFACYALPTGTIVHASMLYDVQLDVLEQAITPPAHKLAKHAVASVRQRVHNLRDWKDWGQPADFELQLRAAYGTSRKNTFSP